jgi:lipid-A-disaccharide synthase
VRIYIIAGEASGDAHAAALVSGLLSKQPDLEIFGAGGPKLQAVAGKQILNWSQEAVVGLWDVLLKYPYFRAQFYRMFGEIQRLEPDAVVFVDYPGFNLRLARFLRRKGFPHKLIYYISPQVWAWNRTRIPRMATYLDLMLCIFPFEKPLYEASGLRTEFVGHPMLSDLRRRVVPGARDSKLICLLPGSRFREVKRIFPVMIDVALDLQKRDPEVRFGAGAASPVLQRLMQAEVERAGLRGVAIGLHNSAELMQRAQVGLVASGTATMEASFFRLPFVLLYKVSWITYWPARFLIRVDYLGMPNILAGKQIIPEFIQHEAQPREIADTVWKLYSDPACRDAMTAEMDKVIAPLDVVTDEHSASHVLLEELKQPRKTGRTVG